MGAGGDGDGGSAEKALGHPREPNTPRHGPEPLSVAHARSHPTPRAPHSRQSFSSSPSPQLSCPLQRKMPGMQRLVLVHLNWLGRQTWMSGEEVTRSGGDRLQLHAVGARGSQRDVENLPQLASSELSWQSLSPSQMKAGLVQIPVEHWNCPGLHLNSAVG